MDGRPRVAVVGIDGFSPVFMQRFIEAGKLPALGRVARRGAQVAVVPPLPANTPVGWATMATGAPPSVTGIDGFLLHHPGDALDQRVSGCYSYRCRAEPLWDSATRADRKAFVVKFPLSYPSQTPAFRLDGAAGWGGLRCLHETASRSVAATNPAAAQVPLKPHRSGRPARGSWEGRIVGEWTWSLPALWIEQEIVFHLTMREVSDGGLVVDVSEAADTERTLASLGRGEWSKPLTVATTGRRGTTLASFRVKVLCASTSPLELRVLNTALHERTGHTTPDPMWQRYQDVAGPIEEQTEPSLMFDSGLDLQSQLQLFELNVDWLKLISRRILGEEDWDLFLVHVHVVDWAHHLLHGGVDHRHPDFTEEAAPTYMRQLLAAYTLADELVATVVGAVGPDADVIVVGDHGQDLQHTTFRTNEWLATQGLLQWSGDATAVDWSQTQAYAMGNFIYLNQLGREPTGVVAPADCARLRELIVDRLATVGDAATGLRAVLIAGDKQHFAHFGADGDGVGDVVFCMRSGYQATNGRGDVMTPTRLLREFTSGHDHFWPFDPRIHTRLFASGPRFRNGLNSPRLAQLTDVAPTISAALGIDAPRHSHGRILTEIFCAPDHLSNRLSSSLLGAP